MNTWFEITFTKGAQGVTSKLQLRHRFKQAIPNGKRALLVIPSDDYPHTDEGSIYWKWSPR